MKKHFLKSGFLLRDTILVVILVRDGIPIAETKQYVPHEDRLDPRRLRSGDDRQPSFIVEPGVADAENILPAHRKIQLPAHDVVFFKYMKKEDDEPPKGRNNQVRRRYMGASNKNE